MQHLLRNGFVLGGGMLEFNLSAKANQWKLILE